MRCSTNCPKVALDRPALAAVAEQLCRGKGQLPLANQALSAAKGRFQALEMLKGGRLRLRARPALPLPRCMAVAPGAHHCMRRRTSAPRARRNHQWPSAGGSLLRCTRRAMSRNGRRHHSPPASPPTPATSRTSRLRHRARSAALRLAMPAPGGLPADRVAASSPPTHTTRPHEVSLPRHFQL